VTWPPLLNDSSRFDIESDQFNGSEDNSDVKSEGDWFNEPQVMEQAPSTPSKMSEAAARAVALEVSSGKPEITFHYFLYFLCLI
jgi:hypothetical protein